MEMPAAYEMQSVIHFLNARNMKPGYIHCHLCEVHGEHAISDSLVWRWVRNFNEGHENVHDDRRVANHLWLMKIWWVQCNKRFKRTDDSQFRHFPCIFHKFNGHFFMKLCLINKLHFWKVFMLGAEDAYRRTQNEMAGQCVDLSNTIQ
jgi:hypothetical protein